MNTLASPASFKGHPLHPILVALPIGLWIFSLVSDVILKMSWGGPAWNDVALYTIGGGTVGALIAALPGFIDFASLTNPKTKSIALWHMMINLLAVVFTRSISGCECTAPRVTIYPSCFRSPASS